MVRRPSARTLHRWWADDKRFGLYQTEDQLRASQIYILCYLALVGCFVLLLLCRDSVFSVWHIIGSTRLHNTLFRRVLKVRRGARASHLACASSCVLALRASGWVPRGHVLPPA